MRIHEENEEFLDMSRDGVTAVLLLVEEERVSFLSRLPPSVFECQGLFIHCALLVVPDHFQEVLPPIWLDRTVHIMDERVES